MERARARRAISTRLHQRERAARQRAGLDEHAVFHEEGKSCLAVFPRQPPWLLPHRWTCGHCSVEGGWLLMPSTALAT